MTGYEHSDEERRALLFTMSDDKLLAHYRGQHILSNGHAYYCATMTEHGVRRADQCGPCDCGYEELRRRGLFERLLSEQARHAERQQ